MLCGTCHRDNAADASFCVACGSALVLVCAQCGRRNALATTACLACGASLEPQRGQALRPAVPPLPQTILTSRAAREGERKHLTVLIADIAGSTALIDQLSAEQAAERIGVIVAAMREAVTRFEGTVNKLQGDGIVALFGAPIPQEDHAVRACCAGLAMIENVLRINDAPPIRVGISTGEVVVRAISTDISQQYEAMGMTVHIAARLEQEAPNCGVLISDATLTAASGLVDVQSLGDRQLRGLSGKTSLHLLRKIRPAVASQQFRGGQKLSPFVGRDLEYQALERALDAAVGGDSPVVCVVGEAGSGKSRLIFEFLERCRMLGRPILEARATGHGRATPLRPILELIRTYFGIEETTSREAAVVQIRETLHLHGLDDGLPLLLDFLDLPVDRALLPADVSLRRLRLVDTIRRLARALALAQPAVFVLEDLHWLDTASEPFVDALTDSIAGTTTLMVVSFRPDCKKMEWMDRPQCRRIALGPLPAGAIETILQSGLGGGLNGGSGADRSLQTLRRQIVERADGNPFFAEELMRSAVERVRRSDLPGASGAGGSIADIALPSTVESVLGSRIDNLSEADKLLLQAASVVGREFALPIVAEIAALPIEQARASSRRLVAAEMLYERLDIQRNDFGFRHPLVQEAAYGSLLGDQRRRYHRGTASALGLRFREQLDEYSSLIAHHWEQGGDALQAASSHVKSALWIGARDPRHALDTWRTVRRLLQEQPPSPAVDYMLMMACGQMVNYAWWQGSDATDIEPVFEQAIALAHKLKDMRAAALITMAFGRVLVVAGSADDYVAKVVEAQKFSTESRNPSVEAILRAVHSHALLTAGLLLPALEANTLALDGVHRIEPTDRQTLGFHPEPWLKAQRARILMHLGHYSDANKIADELIGNRSVDTVHRVNALGVKIDVARRLQASAAAEAAQLGDVLRGNETPYLRVLGDRYLAIALLAEGRAEEAVGLLTRTVAYARTHRAGLELEPQLLTTLAEALTITRSPLAAKIAGEALVLARRRAMRLAELDATKLLETIAIPSPGPAPASAHLSPGA